MNKINLPPRGAFWRMTKLAGLLLLSLVALDAAAANFPVGTHLIKGTLKDWQNKVLASSAAVTIQTVRRRGDDRRQPRHAQPCAGPRRLPSDNAAEDGGGRQQGMEPFPGQQA